MPSCARVFGPVSLAIPGAPMPTEKQNSPRFRCFARVCRSMGRVVASLAALGSSCVLAQAAPASVARPLAVRIGVETLRNPFWYAEQGFAPEAEQFWDRRHWDRVLQGWAAEGYTHVLYWVEPWNKHAWQTFLVPHARQPEARELTPEQSDKL